MEQQTRKTVLLGASDNPSRYSFLALNNLRKHGHPVVAIGRKPAVVADVSIETGQPKEKEVDTVTLYLNPDHQKEYYDYIISLHPRRVIFNPGTENDELREKLNKEGIESMEACTLVLLSTGQY